MQPTNSRRILFVEPIGASSNVFAQAMQHPLLGPIQLATRLKQAGYPNVQVLKENLVSPAEFQAEVDRTEILILTLLTNSANRGYQIARSYRSRNPSGRIVIAGIHVSLNPEEALPLADQVVGGEGFNIITDVIEGRLPGKLVRGTPTRNLDDLPVPDLTLLIHHEKLKMIPVMTSLGCPFGCTFCCVTTMYGREYRYQSPQKTITELKHHFRQLGRKHVFFFDDNLCANKNISRELFERIIAEKLDFLWICQVRADLAKDESLVRLMAQAGCRRVFVGFESIDERTLNSLHKRESLAEIEMAVSTFHKYGIAVHGMFIFGTDDEDPGIFRRTVSFCRQQGIESAQFLAICPFPGTELMAGLDPSRLLHRNWDLCDGFHVNIAPKSMTAGQVMNGILFAYAKMYCLPAILRQIARDLKFILANSTRPLKYRIVKLLNNIRRSVEFRVILASFKRNNREYLDSLADAGK